jgi:hypothetical protein
MRAIAFLMLIGLAGLLSTDESQFFDELGRLREPCEEFCKTLGSKVRHFRCVYKKQQIQYCECSCRDGNKYSTKNR